MVLLNDTFCVALTYAIVFFVLVLGQRWFLHFTCSWVLLCCIQGVEIHLLTARFGQER